MSPSFRRFAPYLVVTLGYWPLALLFLGFGAMGDCFNAECEAARAPTLWLFAAGEATLYAGIVVVMIKRRTRR